MYTMNQSKFHFYLYQREYVLLGICLFIYLSAIIIFVKKHVSVKGSLRNASQSFICRCCKADRPITDGLNTDLHLDIGNGVSLEKVDK